MLLYVMSNKIKIAAAIVVVVVGMVFYKSHFEKAEKKENEKKTAKADKHRWN